MICLAVLLTAYNRRQKTLTALDKLFGQEGLSTETEISVYMVDDGSSDGTSYAVVERYPQVNLIQGTGNLYWNGGMRLAFRDALKVGYDYYLWLNDDTFLFPRALAEMLSTSIQLNNKAIVVASIQDPDTNCLTYGGVSRSHRWRPLKFTLIEPKRSLVPVETMNGNCVLIPQNVAKKVGNLDPIFTHGMGDLDYGLRTRQLGFEIYLAPGYYGYCQRNKDVDSELPLNKRWKKLFSPLGLPPREWITFAKRYAGSFWFVFFAVSYLKLIFRIRQR